MYVHAVKAYKFGNILNNKDTISQYTTLGCNKAVIIMDTTGKTHV
jgi:hypothetical protein